MLKNTEATNRHLLLEHPEVKRYANFSAAYSKHLEAELIRLAEQIHTFRYGKDKKPLASKLQNYVKSMRVRIANFDPVPGYKEF
jgi:hypothetical protein